MYPFANGKPVNPENVKLTIIINRLGSTPETIDFAGRQDYLRGGKEIVEPHSFAVQVVAEY